MADRLTSEWTPTLEEAFGKTGAQGFRGETFVFNAISSWGWAVEHFEHQRDKQEAGIDIRFQNPKWARAYTADVKANMDKSGTFFVDTSPTGWLFNISKTSDRIWHCNPDTGWMAWYGRYQMQQYIKRTGRYNTKLHKVTVYDNDIDFITRTRVYGV